MDFQKHYIVTSSLCAPPYNNKIYPEIKNPSINASLEEILGKEIS